MTFADLVAGDSIFIDANTFVYQFGPDPILGPHCNQLFQRIDTQEIIGYTSTHILTEVAHRLMTIEASSLFNWPFTGIAYRLKKNPGEVRKLTAFRQALEIIINSKIQVLGISSALILSAAIVSQQTGLLSNDALLVAVMQANNLANLASRDTDFDLVPGLTRYTPN